MKPGEYLRLRREAADTMLDEVPGMDCVRLHKIETDEADISVKELVALRQAHELDVLVYLRLVAGSEDEEICRFCGCTFDDPCDPPCDWAEPGLCDAPDCVEKAKATA